MDQLPLISVIMPVYNTAEYLGDAVQSILEQTRTDFEFIIIDDGSTDGSEEIIDRYAKSDNRVRVIHQEKGGIVAALNKGLQVAKGRYVARMDSDDISLPERLAKQVALMESNSKIGVCGTACKLIGDSSGITMPKTKSEEIKSWLLFGPCMAHPTVMMRRDLIVEHNLYYDSNIKQAEDYDLWLRFSQHCEMVNISEPLLLYRVWAKQATTKSRLQVHQGSNLIHEKAIRLLGIEPSEAELELHLSLHTSDFEKSRDYVDRVENWLLKLLEANRKNRVRSEKAFAGVLFEVWRGLFSGMPELGMWMLRKFTRSEICRLGSKSSLSPALSYLRANASNTLEKTSTGRSFKRVARGATQFIRERQLASTADSPKQDYRGRRKAA